MKKSIKISNLIIRKHVGNMFSLCLQSTKMEGEFTRVLGELIE
jgi:hypothetical protein